MGCPYFYFVYGANGHSLWSVRQWAVDRVVFAVRTRTYHVSHVGPASVAGRQRKDGTTTIILITILLNNRM